MRKPITPLAHGVIDYSTVAMLAAAPRLLDLSDRAERTFYALAASYTALSLFTDYPLAADRVIPFKAHGATEVAIGAALPALPWLLGFEDDERGRFLAFGLAGLTAIVASLTDWNKRSVRKRRRRAPRLASRAA